MDKSPVRSWALLQWRMRIPFVKQWTLGASKHGGILDFWIRASECDPWSFRELRRLLDALTAAGTAPDVLKTWGVEFAAGRRKPPVRRGPRAGARQGGVRKDFITAFEVLWRQADGESLNRIYADIGARENRASATVRSSADRGTRDPWGS